MCPDTPEPSLLTDAIRTKISWTIILLLSEYGMKFQIIGYFIGKGYQADNLVETKINLLILHKTYEPAHMNKEGAQWLSGRVLDSRPRGRGFEPHRRHCVVSLSKTH